MPEMTADERRSFLSTGSRTGVLATVRRDGRPHAAPIWFLLDGDDVVFMTGSGTVKGRNLARDARATLVVDDADFPFAFAVLEGTCDLIDDLDELRRSRPATCRPTGPRPTVRATRCLGNAWSA